MKRKIALGLVLGSLLFSSCTSRSEKDNTSLSSIKVHLQDTKEDLAYLIEYIDRDEVVLDSCQIQNNQFEFSIDNTGKDVKFIRIGQDGAEYAFFSEQGDITLNPSNDDQYSLTGTKLNEAFNKYNQEVYSLDVQLDAIADKYYAARDNDDQEQMDAADVEYEKIDEQRTQLIEQYIRNNKNEFGLYLANKELMYRFKLKDLEDIIKDIPQEVHNSKYYVSIEDRMKILQTIEPGEIAPQFTQQALNGDKISIKDYKGKVTLIDFWASWCGPCRRENPNMVRIYNKYKNYGYTMLGVSLDDDRDKWEAAIESDQLTWDHVSDLEGWNNKAAGLYGVNSIPFTVLLDEDNKIIATDIFGEELEAQLDQLFEL